VLDDPIKYALVAALAVALLVAAVTDLRARRIGNWLTAGIALAAPLFWWASGLSLWPEIALQLGVALGTFAILAALFAAGWMGGGDVKLLSALALWIAPPLFLNLVVMMALLGGALTVVLCIYYAMRGQRDKLTIPYGVAIAAAGLWVLGTNYIPAAQAGVLG
jgi:prepilin peptidase CpaA